MSIYRIFEGEGIARAVEKLFVNGYAIIPDYDDTRVREVLESYVRLMRLYPVDTFRDLHFAFESRSDGRPEYDDGFLSWSPERRIKDLKMERYIFHWRKRVEMAIFDLLLARNKDEFLPVIDAFLGQCRKVHAYHSMILVRLVSVCDELSKVSKSFMRAVFMGSVASVASTKPATRLVYCPKNVPVDAQLRFDRSFITFCAGHTQNRVFAKFPNGSTRDISPKPGELLVYWGEKALHFAKGYGRRLYPLAYTCWREGGEEHQGVYTYYHHTDSVLWDASRVMY